MKKESFDEIYLKKNFLLEKDKQMLNKCLKEGTFFLVDNKNSRNFKFLNYYFIENKIEIIANQLDKKEILELQNRTGFKCLFTNKNSNQDLKLKNDFREVSINGINIYHF